MAKKKEEEIEQISLVSDDPAAPRPRLHKLIIKNYRSIGKNPVEIELDDIVVLVGSNNAGKSSILKAYETVMKHGSSEGYLSIDDFPRGEVDSENLPEIELQTILLHNAPGERWITGLPNGEMMIRERWIWNSPNKAPKRQGFDVQKQDWDDQVPWGAPQVANSRRPNPHRIDAFDPPDEQTKQITGLLTELLKERIKAIKSDPDGEKTDYELLMEDIKKLQTSVADATAEEVKEIEEQISSYLEKVFPRHRIKLDAKAETDIEKTYSAFKGVPELLMGTQDGYMSRISQQGSGARRTLLWTALKYMSERNDRTMVNARPHVLLLDEPEICLHPSAIREARKVLYELPETKNWQVIITSHSPVFIDLSYDNTTVIRVERDESDQIKSTTLFRPTTAKLSEDEKTNLKMLNLCDPYLHEFFFGGRSVIVEGDTEYTAFSVLKGLYPEEYSDVQIIRARGKAIIPSVAKILNQFSKKYSILHDADSEFTKTGAKNPAWTVNLSIREAIPAGVGNLIACKSCFEDAIFGALVSNEKPYNVLLQYRDNQEFISKVKQLLDSLLDENKTPPDGCVRWNTLDDLKP